MAASFRTTAKNALAFSLAMLPFALIGGYFTGIYSIESMADPQLQAAVARVGSVPFSLITAVQSAIYTLIASFAGYFLARATGLLRPFAVRWSVIRRIAPAIIGLGIAFALDAPVFGALLPEVAASYARGISPADFASSLLYGGVVEELLLRWLLMSGIALALWKLAARHAKTIPTWALISANVVSALIFAAAHLPATSLLFGGLTPLVVFRCFLLNGIFGLFFGHLYRAYGIQYAMIGHAGLHLVSKFLLIAML